MMALKDESHEVAFMDNVRSNIHFSFPFSLEWSIHAEKRATFYPVCYYNIDYD